MVSDLSVSEDFDKILDSIMVSEIDVDAQLAHIRDKQTEIIKKSRDVVKKLIKVRRELSNKRRKLTALRRETSDNITRGNLGKPKMERLDVEAKATRVELVVTATDGCKDIYEEIDLLETKASELETIHKLNLHISDNIHDMQLSLQSQLKNERKVESHG